MGAFIASSTPAVGRPALDETAALAPVVMAGEACPGEGRGPAIHVCGGRTKGLSINKCYITEVVGAIV
jgi:hypothetical protein